MAHQPRIAYFGHHGSTELFMAIHEDLVAHHGTSPNPGVIVFNRYWKQFVRKRFPRAVIAQWPSSLEWRAALLKRKRTIATDDPALVRAWKMDKVLRHQPLEKVAVLWQMTLERVNSFLEDFKPTIVVSEQLQSLPCYAFYVACKNRDIPYAQAVSSRLEGRMQYFLGEEGLPVGLDSSREPSPEGRAYAKAYLMKMRNIANSKPTYMTPFLNKKIRFGASDVRKTFDYFAEQIQGGIFEPTSRSFWQPFISKWRAYRIGKTYQSAAGFNTLDDVHRLTGKKLLFPLHVSPEASTDVWAPKYNQMLQTSRWITEHLPDGWTLLIKEHPTAIYLQRDPKELAGLRSLPRSLFLSPNVSNEALLKECTLLVINSTLGLEAMAKGYPVITLGNPFYDASGNTLPCRDLKELPRLLSEATTFKPDPRKTEDFIARYYDSTNVGNPINPRLFAGMNEEGNIRRISDDFARRFLHPLRCYNVKSPS